MNTFFSPNTLANRLSERVVTDNPVLHKNKDEIRYGLEWTFSGINQVILVILLAFPLQVIPEAITTLIAGALLRMFSGGAHFKSYYLCLVFSTFQILIISVACKFSLIYFTKIGPLLMVLLMISLMIVAIKAPVLQKKKALFNKKDIKFQKIYSVTIFICGLIISFLLPEPLMFSIWAAFIIQSLSLTYLWEKSICYIDAFLYKKSKGEKRC